jgi:hypothetical protein
MNPFSASKIYIIRSAQTDDVYIGSTYERWLSSRMSKHKNGYKRYQAGNRNYVTSYELMKYPDAEISLLEAYPCENKLELTAKEHEHIQTHPHCINIQGKKTPEQKIIEKAVKDKVYREKNKEKLAANNKAKYDENKEAISQALKVSYECECGRSVRGYHKTIHNKSKSHQEFLTSGTKFKVKEIARIVCECGVSLTVRTDKRTHNKTKGHQNWVNNN